jgi:hypothetical protein
MEWKMGLPLNDYSVVYYPKRNWKVIETPGIFLQVSEEKQRQEGLKRQWETDGSCFLIMFSEF